MLSLPISAKIKAVVGLISALTIVATGVVANGVLDLNDLAVYGAQLVEAVGTYAAIFKAPRNKAYMDYPWSSSGSGRPWGRL